MPRLTDEQREQAGDPQLLKIARRVASRICPYRDYRLDEIISASYLGVVEAVLRYDSTKSRYAKVPFKAYCAMSCRWAIFDYLRSLRPYGYRRLRTGEPLTFGSVNVVHDEDGSSDDSISLLPSTDLDVGWEIESEDGVRQSVRDLSPAQREIIVSRFLYGKTVADIGRNRAIGPPTVSYYIWSGLKKLAQQAQGAQTCPLEREPAPSRSEPAPSSTCREC